MIHSIKSPCDDGVIQTAAKSRVPQRAGVWVLIATILGSSMAFIDGSVVNVALPVLQRELGASSADVQWVIEAYALFLSALILVGGSLGDHFGRRRIFALGIAIFALASIGGGLSHSILQLILARAIQGIGGALLVPGSLAIISASFEAEKRGQAIGTWSGTTSITSVLGPVLGGWLVQYATWRWVFFINIPLAVIVLLVLFWRVPESRDEEVRGRLDWAGALLVTISLAGIVSGLISSSTLGFFHPLVIGALVVGVIALVLFLFVERRTAYPMMPLTLFRSSTFTGANLLTFLLYGALSGVTYFIPFNLIQVQGYAPSAAGAALIPFALTMFLFSRWTGGLVKRVGGKLPLVIGPLITACGFFLFSLPDVGGRYWTTFFPAVIVMSVGMAITVAPLTTTVMDAVARHYAGTASGINNAVSRTAGLVAIAAMGIVMAQVFQSQMNDHLSLLHLSSTARESIVAQYDRLANIAIPHDLARPLQEQIRQTIRQSFVTGFRVIMSVCVGLALCSALAAALLIGGKHVDQTVKAGNLPQADTQKEAP